VHQEVQVRPSKHPKPKLDFNKKIKLKKLARISLVSLSMLGIPLYLFFLSLLFLYSGKFFLNSNNQALAKFSFQTTKQLSKINSNLPISSALTQGVWASESAAEIGLDLIESDYSSLFKRISFFEIDPNTQQGFFSEVVKSVNLVDESRQKILAIAEINPILPKLLGNEKEITYIIVNIENKEARSVDLVSLRNSEVIERSQFSSSQIDDNIHGAVSLPGNISEFRDVSLGSDFTEDAQNAAWFVEKAFDHKIDVVIFFFDAKITIPEQFDNSFAEQLFFGFKEGSVKAFSPEKQINSVLLDLNRLNSV